MFLHVSFLQSATFRFAGFRNTLSAIEDFLELPHHEWSEKDECKLFLKKYFEPWNEKFFELIGRRMDW